MRKFLYCRISAILVFTFLLVTSFSVPASAKINATFRVDMTKYIHTGIFNTATDKVYLRGWFGISGTTDEMVKVPGSYVYSVTVKVDSFSYYEYKYSISSAGAPNGGFEDSVGVAGGKRYINFLRYDKILKVDFFNNEEPSSDNIEITSPGKIAWETGTTQNITWNTSGITNVKIEYTTNNGDSWNTMVTSVPAANGSYAWTVPDVIAYEWRIRISDVLDPANVEYTPLVVTYSGIKNEVPPLLSIEYPVFTWPLNAYHPVTIPTDDQIINGRVGNACGQTAMTNIIRFWEFPRRGLLSRTFTDQAGCVWSADFANTEYLYDRMPAHVPYDAPDSIYGAVATLMYHAGAGMHNEYRSGGGDGVMEAFHMYFNYFNGSKMIERNTYSPEQWEKIVKCELSHGRPLMTANIGHWFIMDGYTTSNLFHIRWDYGEENDEYLPLIRTGPTELNNTIIVYLQPETGGRSLFVTSPNGGENLKQNDELNIAWESVGVNAVQLEYTTNNGYDWIKIDENVPAASGSYTWAINADVSRNCKIRVAAADDINIYDRSDATFSIFDTQEITIISPVHNYLQSGSIVPLRWSAKGIDSVLIQYSIDGGSTWVDIAETGALNDVYNWKVPEVISSNCKLKISGKTNSEIFALSNDFSVGNTAIIGGPYIKDNNTAALLHFDDNYTNEYNAGYPGIPHNNMSFFQNFDMGLDYGLRIDNSTVCGNVEIPDYSKLDLKGDWTIELWFKIYSWGSGNTAYPFLLFKPGANYFITLNTVAKNLAAGYDYEGGAESVTLPNNSLTTGEWYHLTFIKNSANTTLKCLLHDSTRQIIAEVVGTYNSSHIPKTNNEPVAIGGTSANGNIQFDGYVDEVRISDIVRPASVLTVTSPNGGEKIINGSTINITWTAVGVMKVKLEYSTNNGGKWNSIKNNVNALAGSYSWVVPSVNSEECLIRISSQLDGSVSDTTNNNFAIVTEAAISVTSPNGGEFWNCGTNQQITWTSESVDSVKIEFCSNGGTSWGTVIAAYPADSSSYTWLVPAVVSDNCMIRISDANDTSVYDVSDAAFKTDIDISVSEKWMSGIPSEYSLFQNFPNPFNPVTVIRYNLPESGNVSLVIFNTLGQKVTELVNEFKNAGYYQAEFNASELPSGMYIYKLQSGSFMQTKKLLLIK